MLALDNYNNLLNEQIDNKINDFSPIPFYFLNDDIDREEILIQLDFMKDNGITAFFLHVRDGILNQAFGTDFFFENVRFIILEAQKRDIQVWLYDEDAYPSGNCGGLTVLEHPELQAQQLIVQKVSGNEKGEYRLNIGKGTGICGYAVEKNGNGKVTRFDNCFGSVRTRWYKRELNKHYFADMDDKAFKHVRGATCYTEVMFELSVQASAEVDVFCVYKKPVFTDNRYGTIANVLDRRATVFFINKVYNNYKKYVGEFFGNVIPGIFIDEPNAGGCVYSANFEEYFEKKYGYSARDNYYKLSDDFLGESATFRRDYFSALSDLFLDNFIMPIKEWCVENGLLLTGHFSSEENLAFQSHGYDISRDISLMDLPGFDLIGNDIGDLAHVSLILGAKVVTSNAWRSGKDVIMSESFALNPYNFGYQGLKLNADWLFACGINLIVPHGFFYGYSAFRRADAGKSFFFQDALFDEYKKFSVYARRVGKILHEYRAKNDLLIVLPLSALSEEVVVECKNSGLKVSDRTTDILDLIYDVAKLLCSSHVGWDVIYTEQAMQGCVANNELTVGERSYKEVVILVGGEKERKLYEKLDGNLQKLSYCTFPTSIERDNRFLRQIEGDTRQILSLKKYNGDNVLYFLFNNCKNYVRFSLTEQKSLCVYDAENDVYLAISKNKELALNGYESVILVSKEVKCDKKYVLPTKKEVVLEYKENPQVIYKPNGTKFVITDFDLTVKSESSPKVYENVGFSRIRDLVGTMDEIYSTEYMIPYFDTAPRIKSPYPVYAKYTTKIPKIGGGILFDKDTISGDYKLYFNGKLIDKDKFIKKRAYDMSNVIFYPKWIDGENVMEIVFERGNEFDGINGEFFVMD